MSTEREPVFCTWQGCVLRFSTVLDHQGWVTISGNPILSMFAHDLIKISATHIMATLLYFIFIPPQPPLLSAVWCQVKLRHYFDFDWWDTILITSIQRHQPRIASFLKPETLFVCLKWESSDFCSFWLPYFGVLHLTCFKPSLAGCFNLSIAKSSTHFSAREPKNDCDVTFLQFWNGTEMVIT